MPTQIKELILKNQVIYPVTKSDAVVFPDSRTLTTKINEKQNKLVSGENIKTLRGQSILGSGDIPIIDGLNVLFYSGRFFNNGQPTVYNSTATEYELSAADMYYGNIAPKVGDIILTFIESTLLLAKITGTMFVGAMQYFTADKIKAVDLKGQPGVPGPPGITAASIYVDDTSGMPDAQISVNNQILTIVLSGLKGAQGNSGYSGAANELEVVNNLTDGGETAALSAEMGKTLNEAIPHIITISEGAYDLLVQSHNVDPTVYYFIYEE